MSTSQLAYAYNVYGLRNGNAGANWGETNITWLSAPGNDTNDVSEEDPMQTVFLGSFTTPTNRALGTTAGFSSLVFRDFLNQFTNSSATLILSRITQDGVIDNFASRENTNYAGPAITFVTVPKIADQTIAQNTAATVLFNVDSAVTSNLSVTAKTSNTNLLLKTNIVFNVTNGVARIATLTPLPNQTGTSLVTFTVSDGLVTDSNVFQLIVNTNTGYDAWAMQITNGLTGFNQAATGDGFPNLLKYATGANPTQSDTLAMMTGLLTNGIFALNFRRNTNATDVSLIVEGGGAVTNGANWNGIATNQNGSWNGATNVLETGATSPVTVIAQDSAPVSTNRFLRLRILRP